MYKARHKKPLEIKPNAKVLGLAATGVMLATPVVQTVVPALSAPSTVMAATETTTGKLTTSLTKVKNLKPRGTSYDTWYTPASWNSLMKAAQNAQSVLNDTTASDQQISDQNSDLATAIKDLQTVDNIGTASPADAKAALSTLLNTTADISGKTYSQLTEKDFDVPTDGTVSANWQQYQAALTEATNTMNSVSSRVRLKTLL